MYAVSDIPGLQLASKEPLALMIGEAGAQRTIWGFYKDPDADMIGANYPLLGADFAREVAAMINDPRLLEVLGITEIVHRYLEESFTQIRKGLEGVNVAANPLSILFWNNQADRVQRIVTRATELLHKAMEKVALREGSVDKINAMLGQHFNLKIATGCSCCTIVGRTEDMPTVLASEYYWKREQLGRRYDSDALAATSDLFMVPNIGDVPQWVLDSTADFGAAEVASYQRLERVAAVCLAATPPDVDMDELKQRARCFLGGQCACPINLSPITGKAVAA